jgi:tRNA dimethylallyltransferase
MVEAMEPAPPRLNPPPPATSRAAGAADLTPVALAGPTASGKSAAALAIARALAAVVPVEIVSVDSALVYRGMDIGTAKPTAAEQAEVPHHGIDLIEPTERYSAAQFVADARRWVGDIQARGALPLLVGGTMLYLKALREGLDAMPAADAALRAQIDARAEAEGWPALHAALARVDPVTAARLKPMDAQRIQRALEVWHLTGRPLSAFHAGAASADSAPGTSAAAVASATAGLPVRLIALEPSSRAWLHERIALRFDAMLAVGMLDEVRRLRARGDLDAGLPSMRCVGYRQACEALDAFERQPAAQRPAALEDDRPAWTAFRAAGIAATRQLAKRQLTWLRSMPDRTVVACDGDDPVGEVLACVRQWVVG